MENTTGRHPAFTSSLHSCMHDIHTLPLPPPPHTHCVGETGEQQIRKVRTVSQQYSFYSGTCRVGNLHTCCFCNLSPLPTLDVTVQLIIKEAKQNLLREMEIVKKKHRSPSHPDMAALRASTLLTLLTETGDSSLSALHRR